MQTIITGVVSFAEEKDANLICFAGGYVYLPGQSGLSAQANVVYDLASPTCIDGVVAIGALCNRSSPDRLAQFCKAYRPLPVVCAGIALDGFPSVFVDNEPGMYSLITHLVEAHGYRRIAFIRGSEGSPDTAARYHAYEEVLLKHSIPIDPDLVAPGFYTYESGKKAAILLLEERQAELDALVASNDEMALGALEVLRDRGIQVPGQLALVGYDDLEEGRFAIPPLTTVVQPVHDVGWRAAEMVWAQMHGQAIPNQVILSTQLVIRRSCGCPSPTVREAVLGSETPLPISLDKPFSTPLAAHREAILSEIVQMTEVPTGSQGADQIARLLNCFISEMDNTALPGTFLDTLVQLLHQSQTAGKNIDLWQDAVSMLRRHVVPCLANNSQALLRAEDMWHQARVLIGEAAARLQAYQALRIQRENEIQRQIGQTLITTFDMDKLMDVLAENLPRLDILSAYLSLYENPEPYAYPLPAPKWSRLILAYDKRASSGSKRTHVGLEGLRFRSRQLTPAGILPRDRRYTYVVVALYSGNTQLGFCLFEMGVWRPQRGENIYDGLRGQISSAIQGSRLFQARRQAETALRYERDLSDTIIASLPGVFYMYDQQGYLVRWNKQHEEITGYGAEELSGTHYSRFCTPEDVDKIAAAFERAFSEGSEETEVALVTKNGEKIPYYFTGVRAQIGERMYLVVVGIDITERTRAEHDLNEYKEHLEELVEQRTAEIRAINEQLIVLSHVKDAFVTSISHELRTPIASLKLYAHLMDRRPEKRETYIASFTRETNRLEKLIEGILLLSRLDQHRISMTSEAFNLNDLAREYLIDRTPLAESKQLTLTLDATPDLPLVEADRQLIGEVLSILLTNAFNYTPANQKVIIRTCTASDENKQWPGFSVIDTGPGIPLDEQKHMFERFYRGKAARESGAPGTGLGLAIAKEIVELHDGRIEVHSDGEPGRGATFSVWLPALPSD